MTRKPQANGGDLSKLNFRSKAAMAQPSQHERARDMIQAVRECVPDRSNNEIHLVLEYYDYDVDATIQAYLENGAVEALKEWHHTGSSKSTSKKNKKAKNKAQQADATAQQVAANGSEQVDCAALDASLATGDATNLQLSPAIETDVAETVVNDGCLQLLLAVGQPRPDKHGDESACIEASAAHIELAGSDHHMPVTGVHTEEVKHITSKVDLASASNKVSHQATMPANGTATGADYVGRAALPHQTTAGAGSGSSAHLSKPEHFTKVVSEPRRIVHSEEPGHTVENAGSGTTSSATAGHATQFLESRNAAPSAGQGHGSVSSALGHAAPSSASGQNLRGQVTGHAHTQHSHTINFNKPRAGLEKSSKDLLRQTVSLTHLQLVFMDECEKSKRKMKCSFDELRAELNEREVDLMYQLDKAKEAGAEIFVNRLKKAAELKVLCERCPSLHPSNLSTHSIEQQLDDLRADIKHFVSERKIDEELSHAAHFIIRDDGLNTLLQTIRNFGEVMPVKSGYAAARRPSSSSACSSNADADEAAAKGQKRRQQQLSQSVTKGNSSAPAATTAAAAAAHIAQPPAAHESTANHMRNSNDWHQKSTEATAAAVPVLGPVEDKSHHAESTVSMPVGLQTVQQHEPMAASAVVTKQANLPNPRSHQTTETVQESSSRIDQQVQQPELQQQRRRQHSYNRFQQRQHNGTAVKDWPQESSSDQRRYWSGNPSKAHRGYREQHWSDHEHYDYGDRRSNDGRRNAPAVRGSRVYKRNTSNVPEDIRKEEGTGSSSGDKTMADAEYSAKCGPLGDNGLEIVRQPSHGHNVEAVRAGAAGGEASSHSSRRGGSYYSSRRSGHGGQHSGGYSRHVSDAQNGDSAILANRPRSARSPQDKESLALGVSTSGAQHSARSNVNADSALIGLIKDVPQEAAATSADTASQMPNPAINEPAVHSSGSASSQPMPQRLPHAGGARNRRGPREDGYYAPRVIGAGSGANASATVVAGSIDQLHV